MPLIPACLKHVPDSGTHSRGAISANSHRHSMWSIQDTCARSFPAQRPRKNLRSQIGTVAGQIWSTTSGLEGLLKSFLIGGAKCRFGKVVIVQAAPGILLSLGLTS